MVFERPEPKVVNQFHTHADTDSGPLAVHHTLGIAANQAASGNHSHDGITGLKIDQARTHFLPSTTPPENPVEGDLWIVTNSDNLQRVYVNGEWVDAVLGNMAIGGLSANKIVTGTLDGDRLTGSIVTGALIQTESIFNQGIKLDSFTNELRAYDPSGNVVFTVDGDTGAVEIEGEFRATDGSDYIALESSPFGHPQIRFQASSFADATIESQMGLFEIDFGINNISITEAEAIYMNGVVEFNDHAQMWSSMSCSGFASFYSNVDVLQSLNVNNEINVSGSSLRLHLATDGWPQLHGAGTSRLKCTGGSIQSRNPTDSDYDVMRASVFDVASKREFKQNITPVALDIHEVLHRNGLQKWEWKSDPSKTSVGLIANDLPDEFQSEDGYSISAVVAFLWEAVKELYDGRSSSPK